MANVLVPMFYDIFGGGWREHRPEPGECTTCYRTNTDFAHGIYEAIAITLAEPLRKAFEQHLDEHGCATPGHPGYMGGIRHCPEAKRLYELTPDSRYDVAIA